MNAIDRLTSESKQEILRLLKRQGTHTLNDLIDATGLARTTLREHLTQLENQGLVRSGRRRDGPGRPALEFELSPAGHSVFPNQSGKMLGELISFLHEEGADNLLETFFASYWSDRLMTARVRMEGSDARTDAARLAKLMEMLREEGFMPEIQEGEADEILVRECNCPFPDAVRASKLPCQLEVAFYERLFDADVERVGYIPDGDSACTYRIKKSDELSPSIGL